MSHFLCGLILFFLVISSLCCSLFAAIPFHNPLLANVTAKDLVFSYRNRCSVYPRCLLFGCCHEQLLKSVHSYFEGLVKSHRTGAQIAEFTCGHGNASIAERLPLIALSHGNITHAMVEDGIAALPPTSPEAYHRLETCCEFRILYLAQGESSELLPEAYKHMKDLIFLSYKRPAPGELYFPNSNFCYGRMALYLAARQLEIAQGWLYNYFVFLDDDAALEKGNISTYEEFLNDWRPAIGVPGYIDYPKGPAVGLAHPDFIFIGYHREAAEIMMPWVLDYDANCIWASQLMQVLDSILVYRNHIIGTNYVKVDNKFHRGYVRDCLGMGKPFDQVIQFSHNNIIKELQHCTVRTFNDFNGYIYQGSTSGKAMIKLASYHLMNHNRFSVTYGSVDFPRDTCPNTDGYHREMPNCCSLDEFYFKNELSEHVYHDKIVTANNRTYYYVWGDTKYVIPKKSMMPAMGLSLESAIYVPDENEFNFLKASLSTKVFHRCHRHWPSSLEYN